MRCHKHAQLCASLWGVPALDGIPRTAYLVVDLEPHIPQYTAFMAKQSSSLCKFDEAIICFTASSDTFLPWSLTTHFLSVALRR